RLNALKNVLVLLANLVAGIIFAFSGKVSWPAAGVLALGAIAGGQLGGRVGRRLPQPLLRAAVVSVGTVAAILLLV
ncbi:MAG TPA: sulfite exporter TauE/SafE family protein, partial [Acidimicrobiales bacterium]|nr:sulfite exporter TauE/SafE family protein [Acidimicrobiales bacterium]